MLLLDTHALLWFLNGDGLCSPAARAAIQAPGADVRVGAIALWEIAIKLSIGKLKLANGYDGLLGEVAKNRFEVLGINTDHLRVAASLPFANQPTGNKHKDPFDRLMVATAKWERATLLTAETWWKGAYQVPIIW